MAAFNDKSRQGSNATQREIYGDGYSAEMRRRNSLRKTRATGVNKQNYPDLSAEMRRRAKMRRKNHAKKTPGQNFLEDEDQTGYIDEITSQDEAS